MHPALALVLVGAVVAFATLRVLGGQAGGQVSQCSIAPAARSSFGTLEDAVLASGLRSLPVGGASDDQGLQDPTTSWNDGYPAEPRPLTSATAVHDGYEIRWWSPALDHQAADLFVFRGSTEARHYVDAVVSLACRSHATTYRLAQPVGARTLI